MYIYHRHITTRYSDKKRAITRNFLNFKDNVDDEDKVAEKIMNNNKVTNVTLASKIRSMSESADLGLVMLVIIGASGSLAFVVLYNLININISERIREISTIKVLGFYDNEVDMYIFRENIILTLLGILSGSVLGRFLYLFLVSTSELDNMMLIPVVHMVTYVIAGIITMIFRRMCYVYDAYKIEKHKYDRCIKISRIEESRIKSKQK